MEHEFIEIGRNAANITGQRFSRLLALGPVGRAKDGKILWQCLCDCGNIVVVAASLLLRKKVKSCSCYKNELTTLRNTTHNLRRVPIYHVWANIVQRCTNPHNKRYKDYGGRKIEIHPAWRNNFQEFYEYVSRLDHFNKVNFTLDRQDNSQGYVPGNLRFITKAEQNRNCRRNIMITYKDETKCLMDWSKQLSIPYATLKQRIQKGWDAERAFTQPIRKWPSKSP